MKEVKVRVPATTANLGSGFDVLGLSLSLFNTLRAEPSEKYRVETAGYGHDFLPTDKDNLIIQAYLRYFREFGGKETRVKIKVENRVPVFSGLGSSSTAIVGGLMLANAYAAKHISREELFDLAVEIEGHPDNVSAAIYGGLTLSYKKDKKWNCLNIKPPRNLKVCIITPSFYVPTKKARRILPTQVKMKDAVYNLARLGLMVHSFEKGDFPHLREGLKDRLHQKYRLGLNTELNELFKKIERENIGLGIAVSGAGPSLALFYQEDEDSLVQKVERFTRQTGLNAEIFTLRPESEGTRVEIKEKV